MNSGNILGRAQYLLAEDRQDTYGDARDTHQKIADMWSMILGCPVRPHQVAMCMVAVKLVRATKSPAHADSYIDAAAYAALAGEFATKEQA